MTALEPVPVGTPTWAWPPITAMRAVVSAASGSAPSFLSSTMPWRAVSSAIWSCAASSTAGGSPQASIPIAYIERRMRRTISDRRSAGSSPSAWAWRNFSPNGSSPQNSTSIWAPEAWSSPSSANSQLGVAPQSDITQPG